MSLKRGWLFLFSIFSLVIIMPFCYAHVCSDVISGGSQAVHGCPDPMKTKYISYSVNENVVTILGDVTANHVEFYPRCTGTEAQGCYRNSDHDNGCNACCDYTDGITVDRFNKYSAGSGDMSQITLSSSPTTPRYLSDCQTQRFTLTLTINPNAPAQTFEVGVSMTGDLSSTARPVYEVTINWEPDNGCENACTLNSKRCYSTGYQTCVTGSSGCTVWGSTTSCPSGQTCTGSGVCSTTCTNDCPSTTSRQCSGSQYQTCGDSDGDGCREWSSPMSCPSGQTCTGSGVCSTTCTNACTLNARQCSGTGYQTCVTGSSGCTVWGSVTTCADTNDCTTDSCSVGTCTHTAISNCCNSAPQCNDNNACTTDSCSSNQCAHATITSCTNNDGCCASGCTSINDNNCVQCTTANQATACDDNNLCTTDTCPSNSCLHSNLADMTNCSNGAGRCCAGFCDTSLGNSGFAPECRSIAVCSGQNWQYNIANNGTTCSIGICSGGFCEKQGSEEKNETIEENISSGGSTYYATPTQLKKGSNKIYSSGDKLNINLNGESHTVAIQSISLTTVKINVNSTPQQALLAIGETKKFSLTSGWYDLAVTLYGIIGSGTTAKANITVMSIKEEILGIDTCNEDWDCEEWDKCSKGEQTRICTDLNDCDTYEDKPTIKQDCNNPMGKKIIIYLLIGIVIIIAIIFFFRWRKNKTSLPTQTGPPVNSPRNYPPPRSYPSGYTNPPVNSPRNYPPSRNPLGYS